MIDLMIVAFSEEAVSADAAVVVEAAVFVRAAVVVVVVVVVVAQGGVLAGFVVGAESVKELGFGSECLSGN